MPTKTPLVIGHRGASELAHSVAKLIKLYKLEKQVVIVSFNLALVAQIKRIDPAIITGALFEPRREMARLARKRRMIDKAIACGADEILLHYLVVTESAVRLAQEQNLRIVVWTMDDPKWMPRASSLGIHAV